MDSHARLDTISFSMLINNLIENDNSMNNILQQSFNDTGDHTKPTSKSFIDHLEIHIITEEEEQMDTMCSICQDTMKKGNKSYKLPCPDNNHYFCIGDNPDECDGILPWLKENNTCPICRYELPLEEEKDEKEDETSTTSLQSSNIIPNNTDESVPEPEYSEIQIQITEPIYEEYDGNDGNDGNDNEANVRDNNVESARQRRLVIGHRISRRPVNMYHILNNLYNLPSPPPSPTASENILNSMLSRPLIMTTLGNIPSHISRYGDANDDGNGGGNDDDDDVDDDGFSDYDMESAILRSIQETSHTTNEDIEDIEDKEDIEDIEDNVTTIIKETITDIIDNIVRIS